MLAKLKFDRSSSAGFRLTAGEVSFSLEQSGLASSDHAQNRLMVAALTEKGYDVNYCWGIGTHSNKQGGAMLPEMLRWLWRDYPCPDDPHDDRNRKLFVPVEN